MFEPKLASPSGPGGVGPDGAVSVLCRLPVRAGWVCPDGAVIFDCSEKCTCAPENATAWSERVVGMVQDVHGGPLEAPAGLRRFRSEGRFLTNAFYLRKPTPNGEIMWKTPFCGA